MIAFGLIEQVGGVLKPKMCLLTFHFIDLKGQLDTISRSSIIRHIYETILRLYDTYTENSIRGRLLQCLGFLFRAQPTLMTLESSATMMDAIFAEEEEENRGRLLKLMQEFLLSESSKHSALEKGP